MSLDITEYQALLNSVAEQVSAPDYFPLVQPENDLHPDPRALRDEITVLRNRVSEIEKRLGLRNHVGHAFASR